MQPTTTALPRIRALDGLRGLAVGAVLAYHCGFGWARGGFLGVSLFFTLSGYLITSLLLAERSATGRIALGAFWARRARRLLPAALVALAGIVVFGASVATGSQLRALRGDVLGALSYVANWRFVLAGSSYGDLWSAPSPVQHFWSLAIEEQLYVVLPLLVTAALTLGRGRRRPLAIVLAVALGASVTATFTVTDQLRAYYGTDVRAAELLAGALLAVVLSARPDAGRQVARGGPVALALLLVAWSTTTQTDGRLYDGGLLLHAVLAVVVLLAARGDGAVAAVLAVRPLRWLGRISYGAYLYHWPIFLWLSEARTGLDGVPLAAVRVAVSLGLAELSTRLLEEPIRHGIRLPRRAAPVAFTTAAVGIAAAIVVVTASPPVPAVTVDLSADAPRLVAPPSTLLSAFAPTTATPVAPSTTAAAPPTGAPGPGVVTAEVPRAPGEPLRVYVAGDSNAYILGTKMQRWGAEHGVEVWASGWFACHIVPGGTYRWAGQPKHTESKCNDWRAQRMADIAAIRPHVVLVIFGSFDLLDRRWDGSDTWTHIGKPDFDQLLVDGIEEMTDVLAVGGARVLWATYPRTRTGVIDGVAPPTDHPEVASYRVDRLNTFIRAATAARPFAGVIDLRRHLQTSWPGGELDPERRPDGIHPSDTEAAKIAAWMGTQIVTAVSRR